MEGCRLRASVGLYRDVAKAADIDDGGKTVSVKPGERLMVDLVGYSDPCPASPMLSCYQVNASMDPTQFPDPEMVDLSRDLNSYLHYGKGPHQCLGMDLSKTGLSTMLKTVCKLDNLRRAAGPQGQIQKIKGPGNFTVYMTSDYSQFWPFPTGMKVNWDGELPPLK